MSKLLMVLILAIPLSGSWKDLSLEERYDWVVRHFGEYEAERLERMNLLEDDWLFEGRQPESLNVRIVGRWPFGPTFEVTGDTIRNLVFQGSGSGVRILDISNMPNVNELSRIAAPYAGLIRGLAIKDTILVVLQGADGFSVYGITNPANPSELARIFIGQWLNDCVIQDSLLYIAGDDSLRIYNLKDPRNPAFLGGCGLPNEGHGVYVQGSYAYLACWNSGMYIYDVSDPSNPQQVGVWPGGGVYCLEIQVSGNHAYVATNAGLYIINVSNAGSPWEESFFSAPENGGVFVLDSPLRFAYLATRSRLWVVDVTDSSNPQLVDSVTSPGWGEEIWATKEAGSDAYIFLGDNFEGLGVYDCNQPSNVQWLYQYGEADGALDIVVQGNYAYIADDRAGVKIIDCSNPQNPQEIAKIDTTSSECHLDVIGIKDTVLFISGWWGNANKSIFRSFSIVDPSIPYELDRRQTHSYGNGSIAIAESIAFFADVAVEAINISDPANLDTFRSYVLGDGAFEIFARDSLVYLAASNDGLVIVNYSDPWNPYQIGSFPVGSWSTSICIRDTIAFVNDYLNGANSGIYTVDISDPANPRELGFYYLYRPGGGFTTYDNLLFNSKSGIKVFDIAKPESLKEIGYYVWPGINELWTDSIYVYGAGFEAGMTIFQYYRPGVEEEIQGSISSLTIPSIVYGSQLHFFNLSRALRVALFDVSGREMLNGRVTVREPWLDLGRLSSGVYFLLINGDEKKISKFVLIR